MKAYLIELLSELEKEDSDTAVPTASVNVFTVKIEKINEETSIATEIEAEPVILSQEPALKKPRFIYQTFIDFLNRL